MNNATKNLYWLGLAPLLVAAVSITDTLLLSATLCIVWLFTAIAMWPLQKLVSAAIRWFAIATIAAAAITSCELLMRAFFYDNWIRLSFFLPLLIGNITLFISAERQIESNSPSLDWSSAFTVIGQGITLIVIAAIREFAAPDNAAPLAFIAAALIIAGVKRFGLIPPLVAPTNTGRNI
ncbi:MAG TPA: Rnf-Nqr domain containing protein [Spongiibacteraceae bacterium]|jgi:Na+-translocating ferredoxin:NAD+ oxidoreductase RnfE subunit